MIYDETEGRDLEEKTEKEEGKKEVRKGLFSFLEGDRAVSIIVLIGLLGIALIFLSNALHPQSTEPDPNKKESSISDRPYAEEYREAITEELGNMLASIQGVGRTRVMVTLDGTMQNIYATDTDQNGRESTRKSGTDENADKQNTEKRSCIVVRRKDGSEEALTVGQLMPAIKGVLVVCDGGGDGAVCERIKEAVSAALSISKSRICVSRLSEQ